MSVITVSCSPKVPQVSANSSEDMFLADSSTFLPGKATKSDSGNYKSYDIDNMQDVNTYDAHGVGNFGSPSINFFRAANYLVSHPTNSNGAASCSSNEFYRTPLADRTHYERQSYNISRSTEPSYNVNILNNSTDLKIAFTSQTSHEKTIRTYAHNPYEPIIMHDKEDDYMNQCNDPSLEQSTSAGYSEGTCYPTSSTLQGMSSQQTPQKAGVDTSNHSIQYVNGRPIVVGASATTMAPSTGSSPSSLVATTPNVTGNTHDLSFDGLQSTGGELFDYAAEDDMVALVEDLSAPTNDRFQQPQLRIHTPVPTIKTNITSVYSSAAKPSHHRRTPPELFHVDGQHPRNVRDAGRGASRFNPSQATHSTGAGYPNRHPIHALSRNHRSSLQSQVNRTGSFNKTGLAEKSEMGDTMQKIVSCESTTNETSPEFLVRVSYRERTALYQSDIPLDVDEYCVVQGDRGYDLGRVIDVQPATCKARKESTKLTKEDVMERVLRKATEAEVQTLLTSQRADEERALECIREEVRRLNLSMNIKYCEYQFDRQKLCFYFESKEKIMFVPLLKFLHREYQCRIWLQQINRGEHA